MPIESGMASSAPRNVREHNENKQANKASWPVLDQQRIRYGIITAVNKDTSQVKIKLFTNNDSDDIYINNYNPIINSLNQIHASYGALREGLLIRFFYRGKEDPLPVTRGLVEVIGDEEPEFLKKEGRSNVISTGPFKLMSGGLLG